MNRPETPDALNGSPSASASDQRLKRALRAASVAPGHTADVDALQARVLSQWREVRATGAYRAAAGATADGVAAATSPDNAAPAPAALRRRWWIATAGLAATAALATAIIVSRPDPALEELMQPDVLSQLAIGEM